MKLGLKVMAIALGTVACAGVAHGELLANGGFEQEPNFGVNGDGSYTLLTGSQLPGWTITPGHGVTIHNHGYPYISGTYSVNMDGEGANGANADFYQVFPTVAGQAYALSYDYKYWQNSSLTLFVQLTDTVADPAGATPIYAGATLVNNPDTLTATASFIGTGNPIELHVFETATGYNDNGIITDNFSVVAVPEAGMAGLAAPAMAAGLLRRRARR